ncbi:MAG: M20/M25/M40 family metallo-hydrolase [Candidatus Moduliflexus flocculans]|nr:M20/M25/M40 family metallo-hydrolase [Candidatus Moduliflexus flocculans]
MMAMMMRGGPQRFNKLDRDQQARAGGHRPGRQHGQGRRHLQRPVHGPQAQRRAADHQQAPPAGSRSPATPAAAWAWAAALRSTTITREMANFLLEGTGQTIDDLKKKIETTMKPASMDVAGAKMTIATTAKTALVRGTNVLGIIEGSDPKLKDEYFVVGAHYDHNGAWEGYVWNGADDNGSGSVGVLNIAKAIAASPVKPKRSIIFALWTGEEKGLLGSRYYAQNPDLPDREDGRLPQLRHDQPALRRRDARPLDAAVQRPRRRGDRQEGPRPLVRQRQPDGGHALRRHRPGDEPVRRARPGLPLQRPGRRRRRLRPLLVRRGQGPLRLLHGGHDGRLPPAERQRREDRAASSSPRSASTAS